MKKVNVKKGYLVSAAPMYDDGTIGDHEECEIYAIGDPEISIGAFLKEKADKLIGSWSSEGEAHCDAIDVTITHTTIKEDQQ